MKDRAYIVSRSEFMRAIDVKDIKSIICAEFEMCETCRKKSVCEKFECTEIKYAITKKTLTNAVLFGMIKLRKKEKGEQWKTII